MTPAELFARLKATTFSGGRHITKDDVELILEELDDDHNGTLLGEELLNDLVTTEGM